MCAHTYCRCWWLSFACTCSIRLIGRLLTCSGNICKLDRHMFFFYQKKKEKKVCLYCFEE